MKRGKIKITQELLSLMIFGKTVDDLNIVKNNDCNIFELYFSDDALDDISEGDQAPLYVLEEFKEHLGLRRVG